MIYALVFFVVILNTYLFVHVKRRENAKWPLFFLLIAFNAITILAAFRGNTGTDTLKFYEPFYEKYILCAIKNTPYLL